MRGREGVNYLNGIMGNNLKSDLGINVDQLGVIFLYNLILCNRQAYHLSVGRDFALRGPKMSTFIHSVIDTISSTGVEMELSIINSGPSRSLAGVLSTKAP
jgi:hypothetical protein